MEIMHLEMEQYTVLSKFLFLIRSLSQFFFFFNRHGTNNEVNCLIIGSTAISNLGGIKIYAKNVK